MKKTLSIILAAGLVLAPTAAHATGDRTPSEKTNTMQWFLPDGGTPENVTWPQPIYTNQCGGWIQVDVYPYKSKDDKKTTDALDDDGVLSYGEDHGWAQSWTFVQAPPCLVIPEKPAPIIREKITIDCKGEDKNLVITDFYVKDWTLDTVKNEWVLGTENWSHKTKTPATAEQCPPPVVIPDPTPEPTPHPEPTIDPEPPVEEPSTPPTAPDTPNYEPPATPAGPSVSPPAPPVVALPAVTPTDGTKPVLSDAGKKNSTPGVTSQVSRPELAETGVNWGAGACLAGLLVGIGVWLKRRSRSAW